ncbi:MAG: aminotransferase class V-fold PLP-dependent enzyme [Burkholderiaceae bacterium]
MEPTPAAPLESLANARARDAADPMRGFRARFALPADGRVAFEANSIGAMPADAPARAAAILNEGWRGLGRRGWSEADWLDMPARLGASIAPLIGAGPDDVLVCDNTTTNLFKLLGHAWRQRGDGHVIVTEAANFSTDLHVADGFARFVRESGGRCQLVRADSREAVLAALGDGGVAILMLTHTDYRHGDCWDLAATTARAHAAGALTLWDLSHSAGALDIDLLGADADFAVACGYKYLCGGPGGPSAVFVHPRHRDAMPLIQGWMGHAGRPGFGPDYDPAPGVLRLATGTPPVIANAVFSAAADLWAEVDRAALGARHRELGDLLVALIDARCARHGVRLLSPRDPARRGGHAAIAHEGAAAIANALVAHGVTVSFRAPDAIRFGVSPLYHNREDLWRAVSVLDEILTAQTWRDPAYQGSRL